MATINETQQEIIEEFSIFDDWMDKYEYIIDMGKNLPKLNDELKKDEFLISGCQSRVWLVPEIKDGKLFFLADSDAIITKGIVSLLLRVFNNRTPKEIKESKLFFIEKIGLSDNLSPTRANGLASMIDKIYHYADSFDK
jgi:cysteine desulfuration protein SufE